MMTGPIVPPFMHGANVHLKGGEVYLEQLVTEFEHLNDKDRRLYFDQLCRRKYEINDRLIDLLVAIGVLTPCQRSTTVRHLKDNWQKRGKDTLSAEKMYTMLCEQFAP